MTLTRRQNQPFTDWFGALEGPALILKKMIVAAVIHEAGHAVAATVLCGDVVDVWVNIDARKIGEVGGYTNRHDPCYAVKNKLGIADGTQTSSPEYIKAVGNNLIIAFAGPEAQRQHDPKSVRKHAFRDDQEQITTILGQAQSQMAREQFRHRAARNARIIVAEHWSAIERVAEALLLHGTLTGKQVEELVSNLRDNTVTERKSRGSGGIPPYKPRTAGSRR